MAEVSQIDLYVIEKVKERRIKLGKSQADLAHDLNVSESFIGQVESPKYPAHYNIRHLNELARILGCSIHDFLPSKPIQFGGQN
jgi:transcriptional regulator with XRE-family HTH domain